MTLKIISRKQWQANDHVLMALMTGPAKYVIIHETNLPPACDDIEECSRAMRQIQFYDITDLQYPDISYNFAIGGLRVPAVYEGRGWGVITPYSAGPNTTSFNIAFIGKFAYKIPLYSHIPLMNLLVKEGVKLGHISSDYKIIAHRQVAENTTCPGKALYKLMWTWENFYAI